MGVLSTCSRRGEQGSLASQLVTSSQGVRVMGCPSAHAPTAAACAWMLGAASRARRHRRRGLGALCSHGSCACLAELHRQPMPVPSSMACGIWVCRMDALSLRRGSGSA